MSSLQTSRLSRAALPGRVFTLCRAGFCALALLGLMAAHASAGGSRRSPNVKEEGYKQTSDVIEAVDTKARTVTIARMSREVVTREGTDHRHDDPHRKDSHKETGPHTMGKVTYKVTDLTEIEVGGQKTTLGALRKGMKVDVTEGMDDKTLGRLVTVQ